MKSHCLYNKKTVAPPMFLEKTGQTEQTNCAKMFEKVRKGNIFTVY